MKAFVLKTSVLMATFLLLLSVLAIMPTESAAESDDEEEETEDDIVKDGYRISKNGRVEGQPRTPIRVRK